ncbi:UNVERIFIED_CONTAM: hypothetical protein Sradi_6999800, partial [Sesamum radiatum]
MNWVFVLIFCAGTINSVRTIKETLLEFAEISGLRVNPDIEYEWLPQRCTLCCSLGHKAANCPDGKQQRRSVPVSVFVQKKTGQNDKEDMVAEVADTGADEVDTRTINCDVLQENIISKNDQLRVGPELIPTTRKSPSSSDFQGSDLNGGDVRSSAAGGGGRLHKDKEIIVYNPFQVLSADPDVAITSLTAFTGPKSSSPRAIPPWFELPHGMFAASTALVIKLQWGIWSEIISCNLWVFWKLGLSIRSRTPAILVSVIYGDCDYIRRRDLWSGLCVLADDCADDPWCVLGDFNAIVDSSEASGRAVESGTSMAEFRDCISSTGLLHLPFTGCPFTWHNCSEGSRSLWKRLDRILVNESWVVLWPQASYVCALPGTSDHSPIILSGSDGRLEKGCFRFDNFLAKQPGFLNSVSSIWRHSIFGTQMFSVVKKLKALKPIFRAQRKAKGDLSNNVSSAKAFLDIAQALFDEYKDDTLLQLVHWCRIVFCSAVKMEVGMLQQRAKMSWFKHGDQCSKYFFRKVRARRIRQRIYQITDSTGATLTEASDIANEFVSYYQSLLGGSRVRRELDLGFLQPGLRHRLSQEEATSLIAVVTDSEIQEALFDISEDSAPGPDGYSSAFFKAAWSEIGAQVCESVREFFQSGRLLKQINATLLVLIPKMQLPTRVSDFRPIACCNVLYKVITKVILRRMQRCLHLLIDPSQTAFVPGRSISDNVLLAQELLAGYNRARLPARCTIKVDFQKAYDSVAWDFLLEGLKLFNFPPQFVTWLEQCITTASFSISLNGAVHGFFQGARGLRQGTQSPPT